MSDLEKKLPGYNPDTALKPHEEQAVARWQAASGPSKHWEKEPSREDIPRMEGPARVRGLHRMTGKTQVRMTNGKREYLMHRAMSPEEAKGSLGPTHVTHDKKTSWTPVAGAPAGEMYSLLHHFQQEYGGPIASAWIPEDKIHAMLPMWGRTDPNAVEEDQWTRENTDFDGNVKTQGPGYQNSHWEVVVDPHQSQLAAADEQKKAFADDHEQLHTRINDRSARGLKAATGLGRQSVGKTGVGDLDPSVYYNQNLGKSEVLSKATRPEDLASIGKASTPEGPKVVDHTPHLNSHPASIDHQVQAYRNHVVNSPDPVKKEKLGADTSGGITKKVIYKVGDQKYMVKPYHERIITRVKNWMKHPVQGWAEMAHQALYHAGGIGHLHQKVHTTEHDFGNGQKEPALVVHLQPGHTAAHDARMGIQKGESHGDEAEDQGPHHDARRIAMMDFLTNNLDRHGGNLLRNDESHQPLAIDHSRSFQYQTPNDQDVKWVAPTKRPRELYDTFGAYHKDSSVDQMSPFYPQGQDMYGAPYGGYQAKMSAMTAYGPAFDWWGQNSANIRAEMGKQLEQIKDPKIRDHIQTNFDARADWLDERANIGIENYKDNWHQDTVPIYKPGEKP